MSLLLARLRHPVAIGPGADIAPDQPLRPVELHFSLAARSQSARLSVLHKAWSLLGGTCIEEISLRLSAARRRYGGSLRAHSSRKMLRVGAASVRREPTSR